MWRDRLRAAAARCGAAERAALLAGYVERFERWNQRINLSAARSADDIVDHVIDCLALVGHVPAGARVIDVGSGGGLPGLVLAAARADVSVTCVEPLHKKAAFLRQAARELGLAVTVMTQRVEEVGAGVGYDVAMSRATFALPEWLERGATLVKPGGLVLGMEGKDLIPLDSVTTRHPYEAGDRTRAIIVRQVSAPAG